MSKNQSHGSSYYLLQALIISTHAQLSNYESLDVGAYSIG